MAKIRKPASIENGLMDILKILSDEEIQLAIGKGSSYIRKCSNPDLIQQIDHNDSIKLDIGFESLLAKLKPINTAIKIKPIENKTNIIEYVIWIPALSFSLVV